MKMASDLEKTLSKDEILTRYLNIVPFGNGAYGVEAAARTYFGTSAAELTIPQSAMLAGIVQSSSYLNPYTNHDAVFERRNTVLGAMADADMEPEKISVFYLQLSRLELKYPIFYLVHEQLSCHHLHRP